MDKNKLAEESRASYEKFHWNWSLLAGGTLTLLINFFEKISPINDLSIRTMARFSIIFIVCSLLASPIRNLLSTILVGFMAQSIGAKDEDIKNLFKRGKIISFFINILALLSLFLYIFGVILVSIISIKMFL